MSVKDFAESAQEFTKSPLGIIALFIVLVYGFASIVVGFGNSLGNNSLPEGVQNSVSQPAASQADVFVQAFGEVDSHL